MCLQAVLNYMGQNISYAELMAYSGAAFRQRWDTGGCEFDESGYFIKNNWWEETEAVMTIGEEIGERTSDIAVLENAYMLMTTNEMATYGGNDTFYGGQAAYEAWAKALEDDLIRKIASHKE